ncbi:MAG: excisionase family DNA-binding protein [Phycicoccus sp.]|nr:excisionase family DNA-binding protein [Phycicoccus sp.]NMM34920.1 excisionase family DNA-binding protein [Phycicoccus sp.]
MSVNTSGAESERLLYRVSEAAGVLSLSRSVVFELMRMGRLRSVKEGRTRLIPLSALRDYVALLEREAA